MRGAEPTRPRPGAGAAGAFAGRFARWLREPLLRMWLQPAARGGDGLFAEALDAAWQPVAGKPNRALTAARQAFFFSRMAAHGDAASAPVASQQLHLLEARFRDVAHGGVFSRLGGGNKELYTNAFAVLAYAEGDARTREPQWLGHADRQLRETLRGFALSDGGLASETSADFSQVVAGAMQNPQMHLFEAVLHLWLNSRREQDARLLRELAASIHARFVDGVLLELPLGSPGNWWEPGHQCEWFSLVTLAGDALAGSPLPPAILAGFAQAQRVAAAHGGMLPLKLSPAGEVLDALLRIWTQLELVRALALQPRADTALLAHAIQALEAHFLTPHGWHEVIAPDGTLLRADLPASTPYHLVTCHDAFVC